jgi:hypothetical protein
VKPSIGRIVHYLSYGTPGGEYGQECRAAVVTEVDEPSLDNGPNSARVGLAVLNPTGIFLNQHVIHSERAQANGGTWHWPEREPETP